MNNTSTLEKPQTPNLELGQVEISEKLEIALLNAALANLVWSDQNETIFPTIDNPEPSHNSHSLNYKNDGLTGGIDTANMSVLELLELNQNLKKSEIQSPNYESQNQRLDQNQLDCMATMMNGICCQKAEDGEIYRQYYCNLEGGFITSINIKPDSSKPERTALQTEFTSRAQIEKAYLDSVAKSNLYREVLIYPRDIAKMTQLEKDAIQNSFAVNDGSKGLIILNLDSAYKEVNSKGYGIAETTKFINAAELNESIDTRAFKEGVSIGALKNFQFTTAAYTDALELSNSQEGFIRRFVSIVGSYLTAYEDPKFPFTAISTAEEKAKILNIIQTQTTASGFPYYQVSVEDGGYIIPAGLPNTNTTDNSDMFGGKASQVGNEINFKRQSDYVAIVVDGNSSRQNC